MKIDITELLIFFDELLPATNEEQGIYWLKISRPDGIFIIFAFSIYEDYVHIIVHSDLKIVPASISLKGCSEVKIIDQKRKCLEVLQSNKSGRCFLSFLDDSILDFTE